MSKKKIVKKKKEVKMEKEKKAISKEKKSSKKDQREDVSKEKQRTDSFKERIVQKIKQSFLGKLNFKRIAAVLSLVVLLLLVIVPIGIYFYSPLGQFTRPIFEKIPYPVALVGESRDIVTTKELLYNIKSVRKFYESQDLENKGLRVDFTTDDGKIRLKIKEREILDKHVEDLIVAQLANKYGIQVSSEDAQEEIDKLIRMSGSKKAVELRLAALYGWGIDDFRDKVVVYQMYTKKLLEKYSDISKKQKEYLEMEKAKSELSEDGSNFAKVVEKYSEGESSASGGELGWYPLEKLSQEVALEIENYEKGQISDVITSRLGFHIVQLQDFREKKEVIEKDDELSGLKKGDVITKKEVKIRQIFKKGISFVQWVKREKQKAKVSILMKEYEWDEIAGQVRFSDEKMRLTEKRIRARSKGDPSIKREYN